MSCPSEATNPVLGLAPLLCVDASTGPCRGLLGFDSWMAAEWRLKKKVPQPPCAPCAAPPTSPPPLNINTPPPFADWKKKKKPHTRIRTQQQQQHQSESLLVCQARRTLCPGPLAQSTIVPAQTGFSLSKLDAVGPPLSGWSLVYLFYFRCSPLHYQNVESSGLLFSFGAKPMRPV